LASDSIAQPGTVYMFKLGDDLYKVGRTTDEDSRIKQLRKASQPDRGYWATYEVADSHEVERTIHRLLRHARVYGEVFRLDSRLVYLAMTYLMVRESGDMWRLMTLFDWQQLTQWLDG
jgi:hypothetical protein